MRRVVFVAPSYPPRMYAIAESTPMSLRESPETAFAEEERIEIPNFFAGDYQGRMLWAAISRLVNDVHYETGRAPTCIDVGRFTFLEFVAHAETRFGRSPPGLLFDDGIVPTGFGTTLRMSPGPDHFLRGVPAAIWTMMHGAPDRFYVSPEDVWEASAEAIAKALRSVPPRG